MATPKRLVCSVKLIAAGLVTVALACEGANMIGPENQLEVSNNLDNFEFQVTDLDNVAQTLSYVWQTTGTKATVDISQSISSGSAILTVTDSDGTVVYQEDLRDDNDTDTDVGVAGGWGVEVRFENTTGTVNFRLLRFTP